MPRTRQLKHDFFLNEDLAALKPMTRLFFAGLWLLADREGRMEDRPARIKAQLFPYHDADVDGMLGSLSSFVDRYTVEGTGFLEIRNFKKHQHIHPDEKQSTIPSYRGIPRDFKTSSEIMPYSPSFSPSSSFSPSNSPTPTASRVFKAPSLEEVRAYFAERKTNIDPEQFHAHYESNGWMIGRNSVKSWKACLTTWEKNNFENGKKGGTPNATPPSMKDYLKTLEGA